MKNGYTSPTSSSPPSPPSPLPVSVGAGNRSYFFSSSPSPSPPFSSSPSPNVSADNLPLLLHRRPAPSAFSLDRPDLPEDDQSGSGSSCLRQWLEWLVLRCCSCSSWLA
ncbi:early nodulin-20-like [Diospyros lotus]|uniref:early nodulin-20-like n=1 Tax=Diospyros lotus TaxID=55363 RepID=UPI00224C8DE4|nr:early nodulin-20-like [Diospyros lotus]